MKKKQLRILSFSVMIYMLLAFCWWAVLLIKKNKQAFENKMLYTENILRNNGSLAEGDDFKNTTQYLLLHEEFSSQRNMIIGEGVVFIISIVLGIWFINKAYYKEMIAANQGRNFLLSITHELKSPIASIKLVLETFKKRKGLSEAQIDRLCGNGLKESERLHKLVNDLLLGAKMEKSYTPLKEPIHIPTFMKRYEAAICSF